jgi:hypothetical protein
VVFLYGPWLVRNYLQFHTFSAGGRGGIILMHRAFAAEAVSQGLNYWEFQRRIGVVPFVINVTNSLDQQRHNSDSHIRDEQNLANEAVAAIRAHPLSYLKGSFEEFCCGQAFNPTSISLIGERKYSYFQKINYSKPYYYFAILSFIGILCYLRQKPFGTMLFFHIAFYYFFVNSMVNSAGCYYTTYMLELFYVGFSLFIVAVLKRSLPSKKIRRWIMEKTGKQCAG